MHNRITVGVAFLAGFMAGGLVLLVHSQETRTKSPKGNAPPDAVAEAQTPKDVPMERPEQKKTAHDLSDIFAPNNALPITGALANQTDNGRMPGFDFYRDPLGAMKPGMTFEDVYKAGVAAKPKVMATQRKLLESRYHLEPKLDPVAKMSRGKPLAVGPTARLPEGTDWADAGRHESGGDPPQGRVPVQGAASSRTGWRAGRPGLSPDADQDVSPAGALRRRTRPARSILARVSAGDVSAESPRVGRRVPWRGRVDQQLLPPVRGYPDSRAA